MAPGFAALVAEIQQIVSAPYAPLHNVLRQHDTSIVQDWAICHEEQVPKLAAALIQGLALWPYTLDIIHHIASVPAIRDAILLESPGLLSHLLEKATTTSTDVALTISICISFLSEPLPKGLPLPATAQTFLSQLFENAMKRPSVTSVGPVYALLDGACADLLELLPQASLDQLRDQLTQLMRTARKIEEQPLSLYCLAIIAKLNKFHHVKGEHAGRRSSVRFTPSSQSPRDMSAHNWEEVQKFFQGERALKTIHLLVLQVIYACRLDGKDSDHTSVKNVRIAREVLSVIDSSARENWLQSNGAITKKLYEKAASNSLSNLLRLEAVAFSAMFNTASGLGSTITSILLERLTDLSAWRLQDRHVQDALSIALTSAASQMNMRFWSAMLAHICQAATARGETCMKQNAVVLLAQLGRTVCRNETARQGLIACMESEQVQRPFYTILAPVAEAIQPRSIEDHTNSELSVEMCVLILEGVRVSAVDQSNAYQEVASQALAKLKQLATEQKSAKIAAPWQMAAVSFVEQKCTPEEQGASHNWQQRLAIELDFDSSRRQESITRLIGQICRDLQERCDNVEQPLRAQQARYEDLKIEYGKLQTRAQEVQNQLVCQGSEMEALRRSKEQVQEDLEAALTECDTIMQEKDKLEEDIRKSRDDDQQKHEAIRRDLDAQNLELRTTLACNEEQRDEQAQEIARLQRQVSQLEGLRREDNKRAAQEKQALEDIVLQLKSQHQQSEAVITDQTSQIHDLLQINNDLQATIANQERQIADIQAQSDQQLTAATSVNDSLNRSIEHLRSEHDQAMASAQETIAIMQRELSGKLESAHVQLNELRATTAEELQTKDVVIADLQRKAQKSLDEVHKKTSQLEEAQRMKGRLLLAMGLDNGQSHSHSHNHIRSTQERHMAKKRRNAGGRREQRTPMLPQRPDHDADMTDDEAEALENSHQQSHTQHDDQEQEQDSDSPYFGSPIASLGGLAFDTHTHTHTEAASHSQHRLHRTPAAAFKIPTMRPSTNLEPLPKTIRSPPRRRRSALQPLADASGEFANRDLGRGSSPRRKTAGFVSAREVKLGMMEE